MTRLLKLDDTGSTTRIYEVLVDKFDLIIQTQQAHGAENEENQAIEDTELMVENQTVYKTLQLFKNELLLIIFDHMIDQFILDQNSDSLAKCLTQCLKLYDLKLSPGRNQMQMKLTQSSELQVRAIPSRIQLFCQLTTIQKLMDLI